MVLNYPRHNAVRYGGRSIIFLFLLLFSLDSVNAGLTWNVVETSTSLTYKFEGLDLSGNSYSKFASNRIGPQFGDIGFYVAKDSLGAPAPNGTFTLDGQGLGISIGSDIYGAINPASIQGPYLQLFWTTPLTNSQATGVVSQYPTLSSNGDGPFNDFVIADSYVLPVSGSTINGGGSISGADEAFSTSHMWTQRVVFGAVQSVNFKAIYDIGWNTEDYSYFGTARFELLNTPAPVPEPASMVIFGLGVVGAVCRARRKTRA